MPRQIINYSLTEILICFIVVGYAAVDLVPCDRSRRVLNTSWGTISDGPAGSNYTQDSHCEWLIKANETNKFISLSFRSMGTECSYDYVFVYDGDSFNSPLLGSFSGKTEPQQVIATSGHMLVLLYSDTNYVLDGFRAEFSVTDCPNNCSIHGLCYEHRCICDVEWGGIDCSRRLCPDNCGRHAGRGYCDTEQGRCVCRSGYSGNACDLHEKDSLGNKWHWLSHSEGGLQPRAAHSAVYIDSTDALYVFGGYNLNRIVSDLEIYSFRTSTWTDENGKILPDKNLNNKVEPGSVAKLIEYAGPDWEQKWGLASKSSWLRNVLYAVSNSTHNRRRQRHSHISEGHKPEARYGHAACAIANGFVIFGGKLKNGTLANDLWYYEAQTGKWHLRARYSSEKPPQLTRHTLTCANEMIYLFGGSTSDGEFSSRLFGVRLLPDEDEQWEEIKPRGGKQLDVRVNAHSTVYHEATNSLMVYGGIVAGVARFSKLSDRMFAFQLDNRHWTEIHYTREHLREKFVPRERAFHTANIFGNYLVIFGGYSHRHNKEEICYDNQMYLYHLGCHIWVNPDILGRQNDSKYPKQQGVFAHASTIRNGNTLLLVGGYHGNVNGDLLAYVVPPMIGVKTGEHYDPESSCVRHSNYGECSADPECGWCSADEQCYGRTIGANCTTNLQSTRCPGICPALGDCHSCLIHGHIYPNRKHLLSAATKLGLEECTWCVQNARCHHKDDNFGVCGLQEDSPSQIPGWWGTKGTEVVKPEQCREFDMRPGLTFVKYNYPVNLTQPDHVAIINATTVDFNSPSNAQLRGDLSAGGEMIARLMGFLRLPSTWQEMVKVCISYCSATLTLEGNILANVSNTEQTFCNSYKWPANMSERIGIDFKSTKTINLIFNSHGQSKMELQHQKDQEDAPKVFTFEYLEPYGNGTCDQYTNCLHCLTDSQCGWCELSNSCQSRAEDETESCSNGIDWKFLTLLPSSCSNCSNYISCESCVDTNLCEWWIEEAKCTRIGQKPKAALSAEECPMPCYQRAGCEACLDTEGRCVWCEATQQCFSFSVYTSEYQFGLCREWLDQTFPLITTHENSSITQKTQEKCKSCSTHVNCSTCLSTLSCGWCYNSTNPMSGVCTQGDFNHPATECSEILKSEDAKWAYAQCPDVDECGLGIHDCHPQAICTNTHGSFSCHCKKGYIGDGRTSCVRTCYNVCVHGKCQGEPDYKCLCDLGWYGEDCSDNCGCNNHASCTNGYEKCDECHDYTTGEFCDLCKPGSYGNATSEIGCRKCDCNGHGNTDKGECDIETGICYCEDNTEGDHCERCRPNYSGDPRDDRQCYYQCEARGFLTEPRGQGISSMYNGGLPIRECLWIIKPDVEFGSPIIQLQINSSQLNVSCGENAVYVYDGLPDLVDMDSQTALSAVFCTEEALPSAVVESRSGALTVHYKQGLPNESFSAVYKVISCDHCEPPRECIKGGQCVCPEGYSGFDCEVPVCPDNCGYAEGKGSCDKLYGRCLCNEGWTGPGCETQETKLQLVFVELFNTERLADIYDHLRHTLPRFGHSLVSDRRGSLWMFGGYSLSHGALNDIRLFDTRNITWMQVTVEITGDSKMPQGRYFHAADIVHSKQAIFIFGGLTKHQNGMINRTLNDFWQFDIQNSRWGEIVSPFNYHKLQGYWATDKWPPAVYGHSLTYCRNDQEESLILIGGDSPQYGFLNSVWEYKFDNGTWHPVMTKGPRPPGIIGHSTVFHQETNSLYVFGGYVYDKQVSELSNSLYRLDYKNKVWIELTDSGVRNLPKPRFFHSAVTTDHYMLILGGRIYPWNISDTLYAFSYSCNQWVNLMTESVEKIGPYPKQTYAQAMTIEPDGDAAYVIGGWGIDTQTSVLKIELPMDICNLFSTKSSCLKVPGCAYCANKIDNQIIKEICHRNTNDCPLSSETNTSRVFNNGLRCDTTNMFSNCSTIMDCATCSLTPNCIYCNTTNQCVSTNEAQECTAAVCPFSKCVATDCIQCNQIAGCEWSYSRRQCEVSTGITQETNRISVCPPPCVNYTNCTSCLEAPDCHWSTQLDECIAASYQSIYCAGGVCGLVLEADDKKECPKPCSSFKQCSHCILHGFCGWCAAPGETGEGVCTEGSNKEPMTGTCNRVIADQQNLLEDQMEDLNITYKWHYMTCPKENECQNGHHNCDNESQICVDLDRGFKCECGEGYKKVPGGACEPVCPLGCVRGQCVEPNRCQCDFGYVGANCSIQCLCHGHSNCEGPDKLDKCLECYNNTMGERCEFCKPLFVGSPANNTPCVPCLEFCNGHTSTCVDSNKTQNPNDFMSMEELMALKGPSPDHATCLRCNNHTTGATCDKCLEGHFRGSEQLKDPCRACECHGHGNTCDPITGGSCDCKNNTASDECVGGTGKNSVHECWKVQCVKCKDGYVGNPTHGHQCYKHMSVESKMCFDSHSIDDCKSKPNPLRPGEVSFFVIQPRYMNVDIRIIVDVTQGRLNVYMSTHDDTFTAFPNMTTGSNDIKLDEKYRSFDSNGTLNAPNDHVTIDQEAKGLRTYITVTHPKTLLIVRNLQDRLIITLPEENHKLETTRFFMVLQAVDSPNDTESHKVAYGVVFSRQDQLHIDLFVFFSVFFSCFFLFLAACVVAWKAKQAADVRRARRRHVVEMLHMAKRPFAGVTLNLAAKPKPKKPAHHDVRPVAIEPTHDGVAAVATVFVSLPGGQNPPIKLALASSLILLARQFPTGGRMFLRRRSIHAAVAPPT